MSGRFVARLLQVALHLAGGSDGRAVRVLARRPAGAALAEQVPALVEADLDLAKPFELRLAQALVGFRLRLEPVLLGDELVDAADDVCIIHGTNLPPPPPISPALAYRTDVRYVREMAVAWPADDSPSREELREIAGRGQAIVPSNERLLPVLPALADILPEGGLRRGSVVSVAGATSLALALLAGPSAAGSWCAAVGLSSLGLVAAAELGVALERFPLIAAPPPGSVGWATVVAAVLDAMDVVLAWPPPDVRTADAHRLAARARERGSVLVLGLAGGGARASPRPAATWPEGVDVRLAVSRARWEGLGQGHGRLAGRRVEVVVGGRRSAARERRLSLWLPAADGAVRVADDDADAARRQGVG